MQPRRSLAHREVTLEQPVTSRPGAIVPDRRAPFWYPMSIVPTSLGDA